MDEPPDFFADLLSLNPFPADDPVGQHFALFASWFAEKRTRLLAEVLERALTASSDGDLLRLRLDAGCSAYDLWAEPVATTSTIETLQSITRELGTLGTWVSEKCLQGLSGSALCHASSELRLRLEQRRLHWVAESHRHARMRIVETRSATALVSESPECDVRPSAKDERAVRAANRQAVLLPLLAKQGWSRAKWAAMAGVDTTAVYGYLNGVSRPRAETRKVLAEALGMPETDLPQ